MHPKKIYISCGLVSGFFTGLLGGGGGALMVPLLLTVGKLEKQKALASSVFIMIILSFFTSLLYFTQGNLDFSLSFPYCVGGLLGGYLGGKIFPKISPEKLKQAFALLLILSGMRGILS